MVQAVVVILIRKFHFKCSQANTWPSHDREIHTLVLLLYSDSLIYINFIDINLKDISF